MRRHRDRHRRIGGQAFLTDSSSSTRPVEECGQVTQGAGFSDTLNRAAYTLGSLVAAGRLTEEGAELALTAAADAARPGWLPAHTAGLPKQGGYPDRPPGRPRPRQGRGCPHSPQWGRAVSWAPASRRAVSRLAERNGAGGLPDRGSEGCRAGPWRGCAGRPVCVRACRRWRGYGRPRPGTPRRRRPAAQSIRPDRRELPRRSHVPPPLNSSDRGSPWLQFADTVGNGGPAAAAFFGLIAAPAVAIGSMRSSIMQPRRSSRPRRVFWLSRSGRSTTSR
jgi:hypothetical protein